MILCECYTFDHVFIPMLRDKDHNNLKQIFFNYSFRLITMNDNLSLVYSIISAFAGRYVDEYIIRYGTIFKSEKKGPNKSHYLLFRR